MEQSRAGGGGSVSGYVLVDEPDVNDGGETLPMVSPRERG